MQHSTNRVLRFQLLPHYIRTGRRVLDQSGIKADLTEAHLEEWLGSAMAAEIISTVDLIDFGVGEAQIANNLGFTIANATPMAGVIRQNIREITAAYADPTSYSFVNESEKMGGIRCDGLNWLKKAKQVTL